MFEKRVHDGGILGRDEEENKIIDNIEFRKMLEETAEKLIPLFRMDLKVGDVSKMLERTAPMAVITLIDVMNHAKSPKVRAEAAKTLSFMAGFKPVEKNINIEGNIDRMSETQLDAFIRNSFESMSEQDKLGIINLVRGADGSFSQPKGLQVPNVKLKDIPESEV